jgi:hypothetical protein
MWGDETQVYGSTEQRQSCPAVCEDESARQRCPLFRICRPRMGRRWHANHGRTPNRGQRLLDCQIQESAVIRLHNEGETGLDWETGDMREKPCLGCVLRERRAQERCVKLGRAIRLAGRVHELVGVCMQRVKQTLQGCAWAENRLDDSEDCINDSAGRGQRLLLS